MADIFSQENLDALVTRAVERVTSTIPQILLSIVIFYIVYRVVSAALDRLEKHFLQSMTKKSDYPVETEKRITTIFGVLRKSTFVLIFGLAALVVLKACGVEIAPILAAAGVLGLAIGLGAQGIVRDVFTGILLLIENHIRVGDVVEINGKSGLVEAINLRTIVLRDANGVVHVIPSGLVNELSNMTKDWSAAVLDVGVSYDCDLDRVMEVMREVGRGMQQDELYREKIINEIEVFGVDSFGDSAINLRARFKVKPAEQWLVGREYRKRLKVAFEVNGIEIPFPQRTLHVISTNGSAPPVSVDKLVGGD